MKTIEMIAELNNLPEYKYAVSSGGTYVKKDNAGVFVYCHESGMTDESKGYQGWVNLTDLFLQKEWEIKDYNLFKGVFIPLAFNFVSNTNKDSTIFFARRSDFGYKISWDSNECIEREYYWGDVCEFLLKKNWLVVDDIFREVRETVIC